MRIYISMVQMVVPKRKLSQVCLMKGINMVYLILDNPCSSTKMRLVKKLRIEYKTSLMKERRDQVYARLIRKCAGIDDLFYFNRNITAVQEETCQFNDQLKLLMSLHEEIHAMLEEEKKVMNGLT